MKNFFKFLIPVLALIFLIMPVLVLAQGGPTEPPVGGPTEPVSFKFTIPNPFSGGTSIESLIRTIINDILIPIGGVVATVMIIYAGFLYVTARGSDTQITKAHEALKWGVIGAAILLGAWVISEAIGGTIKELQGK